MNKINDKLFNWSSTLEADTRDLAERASQMPFVYPHLALMPDAHLWRGSAVGWVIPTFGAIMPAAVGTDPGCGLICVKTNYLQDDITASGNSPADLTDAIEQAIPLSEGAHNFELTETASRRAARLETRAVLTGFDPALYAHDWRLQLGTLGSGNHSIEVSVDESDSVWLSVHSGSRGVGNTIAAHSLGVAHDLSKRYLSDLPELDLCYFVEGTAEFEAFIGQVQWAQHFAMASREEMMDRLVSCFGRWISRRKRTLVPIEQPDRINCHHNFVRKERHRGKEVWISRKGAIDAHAGIIGLIPGAAGSATYVVKGKGNRAALCSSPHGAGWGHSRPTPSRTSSTNLDTSGVLAAAADLVQVQHTLRPLLRVTGG